MLQNGVGCTTKRSILGTAVFALCAAAVTRSPVPPPIVPVVPIAPVVPVRPTPAAPWPTPAAPAPIAPPSKAHIVVLFRGVAGDSRNRVANGGEPLGHPVVIGCPRLQRRGLLAGGNRRRRAEQQ